MFHSTHPELNLCVKRMRDCELPDEYNLLTSLI